MKKILFITAFVPSNLSAAENYSKQLLNELSQDNIIDLVYFKYKKDLDYTPDSSNINVIKVFPNNKLIKLINFILYPLYFPLFTVRFNFYRRRIIQQLINRKDYDVIFYDHSQVFIYHKFNCNTNATGIFMVHDVETQRYSRKRNRFILKWCNFTEKIMFQRIKNIYCFSDKDKKLLFQLFNIKSKVTTFFLEDNIVNANPNKDSNYDYNYVVMFARWSRKDNSDGLNWFVDKVLPNIKKDICVKIIGAGIPSITENKLIKYNNVQVLGFIDNPYSIITNARCLISPLFTGAGVKVKVIDSLACGTPVIGTDISFEGILSVFEDYLIIANKPDEFVEKINSFSISLDRKKELKKLFFKVYKKNSIPSFIRTL